MIVLKVNSEEEMLQLGAKIGDRLRTEDLLFLSGDLGAGKTTLVKGIAQGLGIEEQITSPTFQLKKSYQGRLILNHLDLYRLTSEAELEIIEPEQMILEGITVVEWGELLNNRLRTEYLEIQIDFGPGPTFRKLKLIPHGTRYENMLEGLKIDVNIGT